MIFEYQTFDTCIATREQQKLYRRVLTAADSRGRAGIKDRQKNARVRGGIRKMTIYVNAQAGPAGDGSADYPFRTIQEAADIALPGDEVLVAPGVYRENVDPKNAGREDARIVYRSEEPRAAVITGAEIVKGWEPYADENGTVVPNVYKVLVPNSIFGDYNPYTTLVAGDWFIAFFIAHTGEVYLNGKAMYEVTELSKVVKPEIYKASWDPDFTVFTWYTEQDEENDCTVLYANFQGADPNEENVEINVRENCFYPQKEHVNYITLSGFTVKQAATQWAPPTAYQEGMIGPHWSRGWIIEDCEVSDSKCSGISLGKYKQPDNDNRWLTYKLKNGTQTERDNIIQAEREGWLKENIGSHIIRRCDIHDCGQTGIVGHLGGVFSIIEDNHIHNINNRQNLAGAEIGGIKMHAAIDCIFRRNHIHHCTRGLWLDWQAQGTRVTQNLFHDNTLPYDYNLNKEGAMGIGEDIFVEVSHGPTLIDNNVMLSDFNVKYASQGAAFVHNLFAGSITAVGRGVNNGTGDLTSPRYTPYHLPHRTEVAGFMTILHGDVRFYNNIFVQRPVREGMKKLEEGAKDNEWTDNNTTVGTIPYENYQSYEEWIHMFDGYCGMGADKGRDIYYRPLPVWFGGNVYFNGAKHCTKETDAVVSSEKVSIALTEECGHYSLKTDIYDKLPETHCRMIATSTLGEAFEPEEKFENPDGTPILFNEDILGEKRGMNPLPGPFAGKEEAEEDIF